MNHNLQYIKSVRDKLNNVSPSFCTMKWLHQTLYLHTGDNHSCYHPRPRRIPLEEIAENPYVKMREQLKRDINLQNDVMAQMSGKKFEDNVVNFTNQVDSTLAQTEAAAKGHQYEWQNAQDNSVLGAALAANRSGTILTFQQALREMGKTMSNEEFEAAFGIKLSDTKYNSAAEMTEAMAKDVKKYSDTVDGIRRKVRNIPDPLMYEKGSKEQMTAIIMHNSQEEAIRIVALNAMKATRASERAQKVSQDLLAIPGMSNSSEYALRVLANPENFKAESGNMLADIKLLEESLQSTEFTPEQKAQVQEKLKNKKALLEAYDKWMTFWDNRDSIISRQDSETGETVDQKEKMYDTFVGVPFKVQEYDEDGKLLNENETVYSLDHKDAVEAFRTFINLRNKELGINDQIPEASLREAFDKVVDFMRLDQDAKDYMRAMDLLYNPEYYRQTITNIQDGRFKYEILEFVDSLNDRLRQVILSVAANSDIEDIVEKLELAGKLYEELSNAVTSSDYYKNLVLISIEENTGLQHAKFAQENVKKLNELIEDKIAEMLDSYASQDITGDISDLQYEEFQKNKNYQFEGKGYFMDLTKKIQQKYQTARQSIEENLTAQLADQMSDTSTGIGFAPTMRNILAVFFAQGEAFLRLMDDVHTKAWNLREDPYRKDAVFGSNSTVPSVDIKGDGVENTPIYPWPQLIVENTKNDGGEKYELKYPGDPVLASKLKAFIPEIWPEVEFVEEFIKGYTERELPIPDPEYTNNGLTRPNRLSFNAIEFPINNQVFQNTEEVKFFYEIYERLMLNSFYSLMSRDSAKIYNMGFYSAEAEVTNIIKALADDNPYLTKKLEKWLFSQKKR